MADEVDLTQETGLPSSDSSDDSSTSSSSASESEQSDCDCSECERSKERKRKRRYDSVLLIVLPFSCDFVVCSVG